MKRLPIEARKVSTTFALSLKALEMLDEIQRRYPGKSRSYALEEIIRTVYNAWIFEQEIAEEVPDDLRSAVKIALNSIYGEVHNAEQTDQV